VIGHPENAAVAVSLFSTSMAGRVLGNDLHERRGVSGSLFGACRLEAGQYIFKPLQPFDLDACRHGGTTEPEEAELPEGQGRASPTLGRKPM
jgi:hypothetical protein